MDVEWGEEEEAVVDTRSKMPRRPDGRLYNYIMIPRQAILAVLGSAPKEIRDRILRRNRIVQSITTTAEKLARCLLDIDGYLSKYTFPNPSAARHGIKRQRAKELRARMEPAASDLKTRVDETKETVSIFEDFLSDSYNDLLETILGIYKGIYKEVEYFSTERELISEDKVLDILCRLCHMAKKIMYCSSQLWVPSALLDVILQNIEVTIANIRQNQAKQLETLEKQHWDVWIDSYARKWFATGGVWKGDKRPWEPYKPPPRITRVKEAQGGKPGEKQPTVPLPKLIDMIKMLGGNIKKATDDDDENAYDSPDVRTKQELLRNMVRDLPKKMTQLGLHSEQYQPLWDRLKKMENEQAAIAKRLEKAGKHDPKDTMKYTAYHLEMTDAVVSTLGEDAEDNASEDGDSRESGGGESKTAPYVPVDDYIPRLLLMRHLRGGADTYIPSAKSDEEITVEETVENSASSELLEYVLPRTYDEEEEEGGEKACGQNFVATMENLSVASSSDIDCFSSDRDGKHRAHFTRSDTTTSGNWNVAEVISRRNEFLSDIAKGGGMYGSKQWDMINRSCRAVVKRIVHDIAIEMTELDLPQILLNNEFQDIS